ncbi:ATP-binding protein [Glycomyces arizonensis]|uniref:ATP-binding protein n=1 Tax=Glycomyces arizonensis TaxID=256035 RepID=UPI00047D0224|nr:helix-turn-helix domain-containing protein [Glycomyces arizonensis]
MRQPLDGLDPAAAGSAPQLVALLRELRAASGLSIREISRRAKDRGDWLPTSTLAAVLNRDSLPRAEVVAALVRACGGDEAAVDAWLAQRARIAAADVADTGHAPRQLPPAPHAFTGRERELRLIDEHVRDTAPRAAVIAGPAGIGKTALALHWAHRALDAFPDGQLYVDLRGFSGADPLAPAPVLHRFLAALGTAAEEIPADGDERAAMYRSLLSHRRVLVVLDNAHSPEQLRELLPGTGGSTALITARTDLLGLTATHGVPHLRLAPLTREESMDLLGAMVGRDRLATDPEAAMGLAAACGDLPLALRLAACQTLAHPEQPIGDLRDRIARSPLASLDLPGDEAAGLRSCLDLTRDRLDPAERRALNAIGLHPATEFEPAGIAALTGAEAADAEAALHRLAGVHLAAPTAEGRWSVHDLVRAYAREQAADLPEKEAALGRLYDWHLAAVAGAWNPLFGVGPEVTPETAVPAPAFPGPGEALQWLDARHSALTETIRHAAAGGAHWHAGRLAAAMWPYQNLRGLHAEALGGLEVALDADRSLGDRRHEVTVLRRLGDTHRSLGDLDEAERRLTEARDLAVELGDQRARLLSVAALGWCRLRRWRLAEARACAAEAAEGFRELGETDLEVNAFDDLAHIDLLIGDHESAASGFERSAKTFADLGWTQNLASALAGLARVRLRSGDPGTASELLERALDAYGKAGDEHGRAVSRARLAQARACLLERDDAVALAERALDAIAAIPSTEVRLEVLNAAGFAYINLGEAATAERLHREAVDLAEAAPDPYEEARARHGLGLALLARGDEDGALAQWGRSLRLHESLGTYERGELAALVDRTHRLWSELPGSAA